MKCFDHKPPTGWRFDHCPQEWTEDTSLDEYGLDEHGNDCDPCEGCPGYGPECAAIYAPPTEAPTPGKDEPQP